jgi:hypothetical protein
VRAGFRIILFAEPDIKVVGEAADGVEALAATRRLQPDRHVDGRRIRGSTASSRYGNYSRVTPDSPAWSS